MQGAVGVALSPIPAGGTGQIAVHGETWQAKAAQPITAGDRVEVTAIEGLTLTVARRE
jgi:membrane-bound serine protease (ClpP class)